MLVVLQSTAVRLHHTAVLPAAVCMLLMLELHATVVGGCVSDWRLTFCMFGLRSCSLVLRSSAEALLVVCWACVGQKGEEEGHD